MGSIARTLPRIALLLVPLASAAPGLADSGGTAPDGLDLPRRLAEAAVSGGLVVHVGFSRANLPVELAADRRFVLHAISRDATEVDAARAWLRDRGIVERAVVECVAGPKLPHADCLAQALVVEDAAGFDPNDLDRVLSPHGLLLRRQGGTWQGTIKPLPAGMDAWPYVDHDPGRTRVTADQTLAAPSNLRWMTRTYFRASIPVFAGGRMFARIGGKSPFGLAAYCAFTGTILWTGSYECDEQPHQMIATEKLLYLPGKAVAAGTGHAQFTYNGCPRMLARGPGGASALVVSFTTAEGKRQFSAFRPDNGKAIWTRPAVDGVGCGPDRFVLALTDGQAMVAVDVATGRKLWAQDVGKSARQIGLEELEEQWPAGKCGLMATDKYLAVCCSAFEGPPGRRRPAAKKYVLLYSSEDGAFVRAVSFSSHEWDEGKGNRRAESVFTILSGNLWCWLDPDEEVEMRAARPGAWQPLGAKLRSRPDSPAASRWRLGLVGMGVADGKCVLAARTEPNAPADMTLHCFNGPAWSSRFAFRGKLNTICLADGSVESAIWAGGGCCLSGVPAYGLHYVGPNWTHSQGGFVGLAALECRPGARGRLTEALNQEHLQKGPAYDDVSAAGDLKPRDALTWPLDSEPPSSAQWKKAWEVKLPVDRVKPKRGVLDANSAWLIPPPFGRPRRDERSGWTGYLNPASPVLCGDVLLASVPEERRLIALDVRDGHMRWEFAGGARFSDRPVWCGDLCLTGNWDGWVYAIRMADGKLAWRNLGGPEQRRIMWEEKLVSAWPISGSSAARDGRLYVVAGLHNLVPDGGTTLACFDLRSGKTARKRRVPTVAPPPPVKPQQPRSGGGTVSLLALGMPLSLTRTAVTYGPWLFTLDSGKLLQGQQAAAASAVTPEDTIGMMAASAREPDVVTVTGQDGVLQCFRRASSRSRQAHD